MENKPQAQNLGRQKNIIHLQFKQEGTPPPPKKKKKQLKKKQRCNIWILYNLSAVSTLNSMKAAPFTEMIWLSYPE